MSQKVELRPGQDRLHTTTHRSRWIGPLVFLVVLGLFGWATWHFLAGRTRTAGRNPGAAAQTVGVATIAAGDIDVVMTGLGAVTPLATVTVKTQINGQLQQIGFTEGQLVKKGDFLFQIDPRPYQVALEQAQGTLAKDQALLAQARADYARYQTLGKQDSIARQTVDDAQYLIKQDEGTVLNDQGAVDSAKLNLTYCHITSPVDGRVGIRVVDVGNYVQTSDSGGLVVVTQLQPMSVLFTLPEDDIAQVMKQMAAGTLPVTAYDRTDSTKIAAGTLATFDSQVDSTTGTVKLRALFDNKDDTLFPQTFVNAHLLVQTLKNVLVVPTAAVQTGSPGTFVYLVKPDSTVGIQVIRTGVTEGDRVQVTDGLKAGDRVVTDGLDRLRDGARVTIAQPAQPGQDGQAAPARPARRPRSGTASGG